MALNKYKVRGRVVTSRLGRDEMADAIGRVAGNLKTVCGIVNNAAWEAVAEAMGYIRKHPRYRHQVRKAFHAATTAMEENRKRLIHSLGSRLFHLPDMDPEFRKQYGNITDSDYFDFWMSTGSGAYYKNHQWVTSLWNKFRLSLIAHKIPHADIVAWGLTAQALLTLAASTYKESLDVYEEDFDIPILLSDEIFKALDLQDVEKRWERALELLQKLPEDEALDEVEKNNIKVGLDQLQEKMMSMITISDSIADSVSSYDEIFRTPGEQKKALRKAKELKK